MSVVRFHAAVAIASLLAAPAAIILPSAAAAAPVFGTYSVTCADGADISVQSAGPPDPMSVCGSHGYNGGKIAAKGPRSLEQAPRVDAKNNAIAPDGDSNGWTAAEANLESSATSQDRPGDPLVPAGSKIPVLNCSNSVNNPASVNLSTGPASGWALTAPGGSSVSLAGASNVAWTAVPGGQWVSPGTPGAALGVYTFTRQVRINACPNGRSAVLKVTYRADNRALLQVKDAGGSLVTSVNQAGTYNYGFLPASLTSHTYTFAPGANGVFTLVFSVTNISGPTGLSANVQLSR